MDRIQILWADDEIDLLKPHLLFLQDKGYDVTTATSGDEALELVDKIDFSVVLLDENMPGLSGLETLNRLKAKHQHLPVIMITKSEEEHLMEDAIGSKISDYLIKPVNPNQILLSLKKTLDNKRLISEKTTANYQQEFRQIGITMGDKLSWNEWAEVYKKLVYWELELDKSKDESMMEVLKLQKAEANKLFSKFMETNYMGWINDVEEESPIFSHRLFGAKVAPLLNDDVPVYVVLIDNLRFDQWRSIQPIISEYFKVEKEEVYSSILPSVTQYARNAFFAGMMPSEIELKFPNYWVTEADEESKNDFEFELLKQQLIRTGKMVKMSYNKITQNAQGKKLAENMTNLTKNNLNIIVYNFVDMLSHARTEMEMIRELASDEKAYRSITVSWLNNSPLLDILKQIASKKCKVVITTDHGSIKVTTPTRVVGEKALSNNLRYKVGRGMDLVDKDVLFVKDPTDAFLPKGILGASYAFAKEDKYFVYPNNMSQAIAHFKNTFQHGGLSMEETIIPVITLSSK